MRRKIQSLLSLVLLAGVFSVGLPCRAARAKSQQEQIDRLLAKCDCRTSPGCMVGVIQGGELVFRKGYGMADIDGAKAIDEETLFDLATLSRHFTGAATAWLVDNGAARLTDNIRVTIPEMPRVDPPVTVEDLIYHTSGMPDYLVVWKKAGGGEVVDTLAMVDLLAEAEPQFRPGSRFRQSRSDYLLLGFLAQRVVSVSLAEWARNVLFEPAGMEHSVFSDHPEKSPAHAVGYRRKLFAGYAKVTNPLPEIAGDVGLYTNILDLAVWEKTLIEKKPNTPGFYDLLSRTGRTDDGQPIDYAFGLDVGTYRGLKVLSHHGLANGFAAGMMRFPERKLTVICLSNLESTKTEPLVKKVADLYLGQERQ